MKPEPGVASPVSTDRFELREKLGAGGMGVVYRAYDHERRIEVALKTLRSMDGAALYRFKKEFRWLADLVHPNLVTLYELGSTGSQWFFTMQLIDGVSLLEHVRPHRHRAPAPDPAAGGGDQKGAPEALQTAATGCLTSAPDTPADTPMRRHIIEARFDLDRFRGAFAQLVTAVQVLHRAGKVHRDIKPSNVLVSRDGNVVLCDFGLVVETDQETRTVEQRVLGTPTYMAPEQAAPGAGSEASDWYAVGVMLYEALTGRVPFTGAPREVLHRKQTQTPAPPRNHLPDIPGELDRLIMALLASAPEDRPSGDEILRVLGGGQRSERRSVTTAPATADSRLVGRDAALAELHAALRDTREQQRTVTVFVHGASGAGKTAVARHFLDELGRDGDAIVLEGRCYERESVPYKALDALVDALSGYLLRQSPDEVEQYIPRDITALARLFPVLERVSAVAEAGELRFELPDPHEARRRAFGALRVMLLRIARTRPVVLFIDDLQWGDLDSAGFFSELVHHFDSPPLLFLATYRREEADSSPLVQALRKPPTAGGTHELREIPIEALREDDARALIREVAGAAAFRPELIDAIVRESGGSPLFLCELTHAGVEDRGEEVRFDAVLRNRLDRLPEPARRLLEAVAVGGQPIAARVAARAAGVQDEAAALALLQSARLVRIRQLDSARRVESYHDRIRETVAGSLPERELRRVHRKLARALESEPQPDPLALVDHWQRAGDEERAGHYAARAGAIADRALAFDRAVHNYRLALELQQPKGAERCALLCRIGDALANAGRLAEAAESFTAAAELAHEAEALDLKRRAVEQYVRAGRFDDGLSLATAVLADVGMRLPRSNRRAVASVALARAWVKLRGLGFRAVEAEQVDPLHMRQMSICWSLSGGLAVFEPTLGTAFQMRHLRLALRAGEPNHVALALAYEVGYRSIAGGRVREECEALRERAELVAGKIENPYALATVRLTSGLAAYLTGQWQLSRERFEEAEAMMREIATGLTWERDVVALFRLAALLWLGELGELTRLVPVYLREADERGDQYLATGLRSWRSNVAWLAMDDPDEAETQLEMAARVLPLSQRKFHLPHYYRLLGRVQIALYRGDHQAAWAAVEPGYQSLQRSLIKRIQFTRIEAAFLRARAALAAAQGEERARMLAVAEAMARRMTRERSAWSSAIATLVRGLIAAANGDRPAALELLDDAVRRFDDDGMGLLSQVARWRRGELQGGDEGAALTRSVEAWLREQQVVAPARFVALYAPLPPR